MSHNTTQEYEAIISICRELFIKKNKDYGTSWRIMRISSLVDQVFIKAQRIRSIEEKMEQKIEDTIESEFIGIVNYCIIALIQMEPGGFISEESDTGMIKLYDAKADEAKALMESKNHDYGEAWRQMYVSSFTDLILAKLLRIRQIIHNKGQTIASEGIASNIFDMINYAIFALIKLSAAKQT